MSPHGCFNQSSMLIAEYLVLTKIFATNCVITALPHTGTRNNQISQTFSETSAATWLAH